MAGKAHPREHGNMKGYKQHQYLKEEYCRPCLDARAAYAREIRARNPKPKRPKLTPEQLKLNKKAYLERTKEKRYAKHKLYYQANKATMDAQKKKWRQDRGELQREYQREYYHKNKERIRNSLKRRRHTRYGVISIAYSVEQVLSLYGTDCHICGTAIDLKMSRKPGIVGWEKALHIDHVIPMVKGGNDTIDNVRPAHAVCNLSKSTKILGNSEQAS